MAEDFKMSPDLKKALQIARQVASEQKKSDEKEGAPNSPVDSSDTTPRHSADLPVTASEVAETLGIIKAIADGKDPFSSDSLSRYRPEDNLETVRALCVAVWYLAEQLGLRAGRTFVAPPADDRGSRPLEDYLHAIERQEITRALETARHNKTEAARLLGITFRALRYKLEQYGID